ncbi:MAG TPA: Hsp70 family protein [Urbifossiella sp.]|nr:Hsp70 family protein [Urbifossiella sp.]
MDIGIDLGTTFSVIAVKGKAELAAGSPEGMYLPECDVTILPTPLGEHTVPSVFWADATDPDRVLVGPEAKQKAEEGEAPIMFSKRSIGTDKLLPMHDRTYTARKVAEHVLRYLKDCAERALGRPVRRAVITHPAYFDRNQVEETRLAAIDAGFDMDLPEQMMMEPAAASLAYVQEDPKDPLLVLTYDLGGGTFDVTVVARDQGVLRLKAFEGDHLLGGYNFDRRLVEWVLDKLAAQGRAIPHDEDDADDRARRARLLQIAEQVKLKLHEQRSPKVPVPVKVLDVLVDAAGKKVNFQDRITREEYAALIKDYLDETIACCRRAEAKADVDRAALDFVLLVGGSTYGQWVQEAVEQEYPGKVRVFNPDLCVAAGAAIRAATLPTIAAAAGIEVVIDAPPTSTLPRATISGRLQGEKNAALDLTGRVVLLHTPERIMEAKPTDTGTFAFEDVPLREDEPTTFTLEVTDAKGLNALRKTITVAYAPDGGGAETISTNLPKSLFLKIAEGFKLLAEEGAELPKKVEVTLRRIGGESSLEVPVYQAEEEIGVVRVDNIPPDAGEGSKVVVAVEITDKNSMRGTVKVLSRGGTAVAKEQPVNIVFPPLKVPSLAELQAKYVELEAKRQEDIYNAPDPEQRLRLEGIGAKKSKQAAEMLNKQTADPQEVNRSVKELERLVNPPADDMSPPQGTFRRKVDGCRTMLQSVSGDPQAAPLGKMLDRIEADGNQAATTKNQRKWGMVNESLGQLEDRIDKLVDPNKGGGGPSPPPTPPPPTPLIKDHFLHQVSGLRRALAQEWEKLEKDRAKFDKHQGIFRGRREKIEAGLDQIEAAINKVDDNLESNQGSAQVQLALRPRPQIEKQIKELGEFVATG